MPLLEFGSCSHAESEVVKAGPELVEAIRVVGGVLPDSKDPARLRMGQHPELDVLTVTFKRNLHVEQAAVPLRAPVCVAHCRGSR